MRWLFLALLLVPVQAYGWGVLHYQAVVEGGVSYLFSDCFDGADSSRLDASANWTDGSVTGNDHVFSDTRWSDSGDCVGDVTSAIITGVPSSFDEDYTTLTSSGTYTISFDMYTGTQSTGKRVPFVINDGNTRSSGATEIMKVAVEYVSGDNDLEYSYVGASDVVICTSCIAENSWVSIEFEVNPSSDTANVWVDGVSVATGLAVSDLPLGRIYLLGYASGTNNIWMDSLRGYAGVRNALY